MIEAVGETGIEKISIVNLENTNNGTLEVIGCDKQGVRYKLLPAIDKNLATMAWPGNEGTEQMRIWEGVTNLLDLRGTQSSKGDLFVGPAVDYSDPEAVEIDKKGAALWIKVV